jgi:hypothetical protein
MRKRPYRWRRYRARSAKRKRWVLDEINRLTRKVFDRHRKALVESFFAPDPLRLKLCEVPAA